MPGMNGKELVNTVLQTHPDMRAIYMSGYPADVIATKDIRETGVEYLEKSDLDEKLASTLSKVLGNGS